MIAVAIRGISVPVCPPLPQQLLRDVGLHKSQVSVLLSGVLFVTISPEQEMFWVSQKNPYFLSLSFQEECKYFGDDGGGGCWG